MELECKHKHITCDLKTNYSHQIIHVNVIIVIVYLHSHLVWVPV